MTHFMKCRIRKVILPLFLAGILAVMVLPGRGYATSSTLGIADITWNYLTFTYTDATGAAVPVSWLDPAAPAVDTRNSFGAAWVGLNGVQTDPGDSGAIEGAWGVAGLSTSLSDPTGTAGGSGQTQPTGGITRGAVQAISNINLNSGGSADVFIAQAAFTGQFTVPSAGTLTIEAPYSLLLNASTTSPGEFAYVDVLVGLYLSDIASGMSILPPDERFFSLLVNGGGSNSFSDSGILQLLNIALLPGIQYDFEASASTVASATAVPEPGSMILLMIGLGSMGVLKRKIK